MKTVYANLIGRFGNNLFIYAYARALAERENALLETSPWIGQKLFKYLKGYCEPVGDTIIPVCGYHQDQDSLIYTRKQVKEWFQFKPEILEQLAQVPCPPIVAHLRRGDYADLGYVVVSEKSYRDAWHKFELDTTPITFVSEENPYIVNGLPDWLPDFYRMTKAKVLFRANSSFSWWASTLSDARVFAPVIEGLPGGERDCDFLESNAPKLANLSFVTDLHLKEQ